MKRGLREASAVDLGCCSERKRMREREKNEPRSQPQRTLGEDRSVLRWPLQSFSKHSASIVKTWLIERQKNLGSARIGRGNRSEERRKQRRTSNILPAHIRMVKLHVSQRERNEPLLSLFKVFSSKEDLSKRKQEGQREMEILV